MKTTLIVPMYNEEKRVLSFLGLLSKFSKKHDLEVILVNDGSTDNTETIVKKYVNKNIKLISYKENKGKGYAVKKAVSKANGKNIIWIDADDSFYLTDILKIQDKLNNYDIVIGNKYSNKRKLNFRLMLGKSFNTIVNMLFNLNINDCFSGLKGYNKKVADLLFKDLIHSRWLFDVELLIKARRKKCKITSVPVKLKTNKGTKFKLIDPLLLLIKLLKMKYVRKW